MRARSWRSRPFQKEERRWPMSWAILVQEEPGDCCDVGEGFAEGLPAMEEVAGAGGGVEEGGLGFFGVFVEFFEEGFEGFGFLVFAGGGEVTEAVVEGGGFVADAAVDAGGGDGGACDRATPRWGFGGGGGWSRTGRGVWRRSASVPSGWTMAWPVRPCLREFLAGCGFACCGFGAGGFLGVLAVGLIWASVAMGGVSLFGGGRSVRGVRAFSRDTIEGWRLGGAGKFGEFWVGWGFVGGGDGRAAWERSESGGILRLFSGRPRFDLRSRSTMGPAGISRFPRRGEKREERSGSPARLLGFLTGRLLARFGHDYRAEGVIRNPGYKRASAVRHGGDSRVALNEADLTCQVRSEALLVPPGQPKGTTGQASVLWRLPACRTGCRNGEEFPIRFCPIPSARTSFWRRSAKGAWARSTWPSRSSRSAAG